MGWILNPHSRRRTHLLHLLHPPAPPNCLDVERNEHLMETKAQLRAQLHDVTVAARDAAYDLKEAEARLDAIQRTVASDTRMISVLETQVDEKQRSFESMEIAYGNMLNSNRKLQADLENARNRASEGWIAATAAADFLDDLLTLEPETLERYRSIGIRAVNTEQPRLSSDPRRRLDGWRGRDAHAAAEKVRVAEADHEAYDLVVELRGERPRTPEKRA